MLQLKHVTITCRVQDEENCCADFIVCSVCIRVFRFERKAVCQAL